MATTPELHQPQIAAAREKAWFQAGDPLLTLEAARTFVEQHGLVLFAPRPLGAPAPSLVEATLGNAKATASAAESDTARGLVARMVGEGSALPLNLLGGPGELPDFVVSAAAFPFVFTLRGDKGWKRPPETSGAVKVTPLALRVYELLAERGAMTVADMVPEIGREVTDSAISRSLSELWSLLRVLPSLQQGEGETTWELTTARFVKAVKAGANAGQPTALSALVSLYLGQAYLATEEEVASFLSPLTARSRVRDVLHGLTAGRQLSEAVLEGKTVLFIPDALPDFAALNVSDEELDGDGTEADDTEGEESEIAEGEETEAGTEIAGEAPEGGDEGRIKRFEPGAESGVRGKGLRGKPLSRDGSPQPRPASDRAARAARPPSDRPKRTFSDRAGSARAGSPDRPARAPRASDGERRPRPASERPSFTRPWDEERKGSAAEGSGEGRPPRSAEDSRPPRREGTEGRPYRPARPREDSRPPRRDSPGGDRPTFRREGTGERPPFRREGAAGSERPPFRRAPGGDRPPFRREGGSERPPFRREGGSDRPPVRREGGSDRPPFRREGGSDRPPFRREGGSDRPPFRREGGSDRPPFRREGGSDRPPFRPTGGDRPDRGGRDERPRPARPFPPREGGSSDRPGPGRGFGGGADRPRSDRPGGDRPRPSFGARPEGRPGRGPARPGGFGERSGAPGASRGGAGRPPFRSAGGGGRSVGDRPVRDGEARPRPGGDRGGQRPAGGGFSRGPARDGDRGPSRGPARGGDRGPSRGAPRGGSAGGPSRGRPAARKRPEDEA